MTVAVSLLVDDIGDVVEVDDSTFGAGRRRRSVARCARL